MEWRLVAEDYVDGVLNADQVIEFERAMETDDELVLVVRHFQSIRSTADGLLEIDLLKTVANVTDSLHDNTIQPANEIIFVKSKPIRPWLIILIVFLCASIFWVVFRPKQPDVIDIGKGIPPKIDQPNEKIEAPIREEEVEMELKQEKEKTFEPKTNNDDLKEKKVNAKQVFAQHFTPYRHPSLEPTVRGNSEPTIRDDFELAYWEKDYVSVLTSWTLLGEEERQNPTMQFLYVNALLSEHQFDEAESILDILKQDKNKRFDETEEWLMILTKIELKKPQEARKLANVLLRDKTHNYYQKASELFQKMNFD